MTGHRPFADLEKGWSAERLAANSARKAKLADELVSLEQFREGLGISQEELDPGGPVRQTPGRTIDPRWPAGQRGRGPDQRAVQAMP